jgi:hypothetical protein
MHNAKLETCQNLVIVHCSYFSLICNMVGIMTEFIMKLDELMFLVGSHVFF